MKYPSQERLEHILDYNAGTGIFIWKDRKEWPPETRSKYLGKEAGYRNKDGYVFIGVDGTQFPAHRLAWIYITGENPREQIDHKDLCPSNNAFSNLRKASMCQQRYNTGLYKTNSSGYKGVALDKNTKKWRAYISVDKKQKYLGHFNTPLLAHEAYCQAATKYFGEFARIA